MNRGEHRLQLEAELERLVGQVQGSLLGLAKISVEFSKDDSVYTCFLSLA